MSDPVQMPPTHAVIPPIAPVRAEPPVEPAKKSQTENRNANDRRQGEQPGQNVPSPQDRRLTISRDTNLHSFIYRSVESDSGEVVWQWPAEEMLRRAKHLRAAEDQMREERQNVDEKA